MLQKWAAENRTARRESSFNEAGADLLRKCYDYTKPLWEGPASFNEAGADLLRKWSHLRRNGFLILWLQ